MWNAKWLAWRGPSGLMLFAKIDQGAIASLGETQVQCWLYLIGNPAIAPRNCPYRSAQQLPRSLPGLAVRTDPGDRGHAGV
jgi:hypothetical protein